MFNHKIKNHEKQKKFFFNKEENVLDSLKKLDRSQMTTIVGSYTESTYVPKPKIDPIFK